MTSDDEWTPRQDELVFLGHPALDAVVDVCLELATELWVTRRRLEVVEGQLVASSTISAPDDLCAEALAESDHDARDAFVRQVLGPLLLSARDDATS